MPMGALALEISWNGTAARRESLNDAESALGGFATDAWQRFESPHVIASHSGIGLDQRTTAAGSLILWMDGRLSVNSRRQLESRLAATADCAGVGDVACIGSAWSTDGESLLSRLDGDFSLVVFDTSTRTLWLMLPRGSARGLYFVDDGRRVVVATRPSAALRAAGRDLQESATAVAAYFALRAPAAGACYFEDVTAVVGGMYCAFSVSGRRCQQLPVIATAESVLRFSSDAEAVESWREVLATAVDDALEGWRQPGIMLSGGLDSSTLAALAARRRPDLRACSWRLPQTPESDEHAWIAATRGHLRLTVQEFDGDADWPLARRPQWPVEDDGPPSNPYRWLQQHLFDVAADAGCDALISGNFGDHLYPEPAQWLRSGLADRGYGWVGAELFRILRQNGPRALWRDPGWRSWIKNRSPVAELWSAPDWMTARWREQLPVELGSAMPGAGADSAEALQDAELGRRFHSMFGIELLTPYRDPRVMDFAARLPAHYQYRRGQSKFLTREAMRAVLPEPVRLRPKSGSLTPFFRKGVLHRSASEAAELLDAPDARWPRYVAPQALRRARENPFTESDLLLIWLCISYELWWRAHWGGGHAVLASCVNRGGMSEALRD
jgi:asparagine synthase (glutamine-hydrolysing)